MSITVLRKRADIDAALLRLQGQGIQPRRYEGGVVWSVVQVIRTGHRPRRPDQVKAWDIELTLDRIRGQVPPEGCVVDLGAVNSAVLPALHRLGYRNLHGVDLDPAVLRGPHSSRIRYQVGDYHSMPFLPDGSCAAVTAISTIEHGWRGIELLREIARVLRVGGLFIASTDYWPEKIETTGVQAFGLDWRIFCAEELRELLSQARAVGLAPVGDVELDADEAAIEWQGRHYTFVHIVLQRGDDQTSSMHSRAGEVEPGGRS